MKLKTGFLTYETNGEQILVATDSKVFAGLARSNQTAAFIVEQLREEITQKQLVERLMERYDAPKELIEKDLSIILSQLCEIGALDE